MSGGLYSRVKTWGSADTILGSDLNAEFDNVLNNFIPTMMQGYSTNAAEMQIQTSPGGVGSESLATSLAGELARLRYQIAAISGTTYWYTSPAATIAQLNAALGAASLANKINSGLTNGTTGSLQPIFLLPANTTNTVTLKTSTPFVYTIAGTAYTIAADVSATGLTLAPASLNTATVSDLPHVQAGSPSSKLLGENGSQITVSGMGSSVTSQVGNICAFKTTASEYILGRIQSSTQITQVQRGYFFNSSNALVTRGTLSNGDTLTLMKLTWIFASTTGTISPVYTNPRVSGVAPSSPATGDYWFDISANFWKTYNSTTWVTANATLIGICIQDTANTVAARSFDFFEAYSDLNTIELWTDELNSATVVRSRYVGGQINVYGSTLQYGPDYVKWDFATDLDTGSIAASTYYYLYINTVGKSIISLTAPIDRRADLRGYYHPGNTYRCVGYVFANALTLVNEVESFFKSDDSSSVSNITAAQTTPLPYGIFQREQIITLTGAAGAFTQVLPPPAQIKGKYLTYVRTDNTLANVVTLQSWGTQVANPTGTISITANTTTISTMSSTAGIATGQLISGPGIAPNTTVSSVASSTSVIMSNAAILTLAGVTLNFANAAGYAGTVGGQTAYVNYGINGKFTRKLSTQYESVTITSDGLAYFVVQSYFPSNWILAGVTNITATTTAPTKGTVAVDNLWWRRISGSSGEFRQEYEQTGAGAAGSGDYLFTLPTNVSLDTNYITVYATAIGANTAIFKNACGTSYVSVVTGTSGAGSVMAYDATHVRYPMLTNASQGCVGSGLPNSGLGSTTVSYNAQFILPVLNWEG